MSHDNITDTYTYLRLCSAQHKRRYWKVVSIEIPRGIWVKMSSGGYYRKCDVIQQATRRS
jgi:hypothetical protein